MAPGRPNRDLCVPLQTKTRPRPLADTTRNGSCLPDACFALQTIAPAAHDANKASNTKNGRGRETLKNAKHYANGGGGMRTVDRGSIQPSDPRMWYWQYRV